MASQQSTATSKPLFSWMRKKEKKPVVVEDPNLVWHAPAGGSHPPLQVSDPTKKTRQKPKISPSWFCRTTYFERMCDMAFESIDVDQSNSIDKKELYSGLLLIHLKLGCYAGPAACRPLSRERCERVFTQFDVDDSGYLDKDEFKEVISVLFGNVFFRVMVQWTLTLMIVPIASRYILDGIMWMISCVSSFIANLDEHSALANYIELFLEKVYGLCVHTTGLSKMFAPLGKYLDKIPDSVWSALPLGLISAVLGIVVVPFCIFQVDDWFQRLAERKAKKNK